MDALALTKSRARFRVVGRVKGVHGNSISATLPDCAIGNVCKIHLGNGSTLTCTIVGFKDTDVFLAPFGRTDSIRPGAEVEVCAEAITIPVDSSLLGKVVDATGKLKNVEEESHFEPFCINAAPPEVYERRTSYKTFYTSILPIDSLLTIGEGQRIGLFAPAGVGKTSLLGQIIDAADVDVSVVALVGERGREAAEFIDQHMQGKAKDKTVLVLTTSDEPSMMRQVAPYTATTIAEYFRDQGKRVLLVIDSLTRVARAMRETGLAAGELPVRHGYPSSLFSALPCLLERPGLTASGSITAIYTVLTNQENDTDPLADEVKSLLDGHITLSSHIASTGIYPAIDFERSVSRLFPKLHDKQYRDTALRVLYAINRGRRDRDIVLLGGAADPELQKFMNAEPVLREFLGEKLSAPSLVADRLQSLHDKFYS